MKVAHGTKIIPFAGRILRACVTSIVYDAEPLPRGHQVTRHHVAIARLANYAHRGDGELCRGRRGADEALEGCDGGTRRGWEVDVDVCDKGGCDVGDE